MNDVKITAGGKMEDDASRRFIDAWRRAEHSATFQERHLAFESWDALSRVLTGKRIELLKFVRHHPVPSVRALAKALGRDYSNVHADVQALTTAGLLDATGGSLHADYDAIETKIAI
jgi:predicted transcriptional regulator